MAETRVPAVVFHHGTWLQAAKLETTGQFPDAFELGETPPPAEVLAASSEPVIQGVITTADTLARVEIPVVDGRGSCTGSAPPLSFSFVTREWSVTGPVPPDTVCTVQRSARVPGATASETLRCVAPPVGTLGPQVPGCEVVEQEGDLSLFLDPFRHYRGRVSGLQVIYVKTTVPADSRWPFGISLGRPLEPGWYLLEPHPISDAAKAEQADCEAKRLRAAIERYNRTAVEPIPLDAKLAELPRDVADAIRRDRARNGPSCWKAPFRLVEGWSGRALQLDPDATLTNDAFVW